MKYFFIFNLLFLLSFNSFAGQQTVFKVHGQEFKLLTDDILYDGKISEEIFLGTIKRLFPEEKKFKMRKEVYVEMERLLAENRKMIKEFTALTDNFEGMVRDKMAAPFYSAHEALKAIDTFEKFKNLRKYKGDKINKQNYQKYRRASLALESLSLMKMNFK